MNAEQWPSKGGELVRVAIAMSVLSTLSTIWRLAVRFRVSPWMGFSDWLMLAGTATNFVCSIPFVIRGVDAGIGRLKADPFWTPDRILILARATFVIVCLQMYAIFLVKLSVCTYLLALGFSQKFKMIMWAVTLIVVVFNFLMPLVMQFGSCRPYYHPWHPEIVPECWPTIMFSVTKYAQIVSNIATDLGYAAAPLLYLKQMDLTKRMRLKVRLMFLLVLVGTASSIVKMIMLHRTIYSSEPSYDIADLSIWGINEVAICIIVANIPIQRRSMCSTIAWIVPEHLHSRLGFECEPERMEECPYLSRRRDCSREIRNTTPDADDESEMSIIELENGRIVMAPRASRTRDQATVRDRNDSEGTLSTFYNNDSKDSLS